MKKIVFHPMTRLLSVTLLVAVLLTGCGKGCGTKGGGSPSEAGALQLIPSGNNVILGLDLKKLQASKLGENFKGKIPPQVAPFIKDVDSVVLGFNVSGMGKEPENVLAVVSGNLDSVKLLAQITEQAKTQGGEVSNEEYEGVKIYSTSKDPSAGFAFLENKALIGKKPAVKAAIDLSKKKGSSVESDENLMALIKGVDTKRMLWAVAIVPAGAVPAGGGAGNPMAALSNVKAIDLAMDLSDKLTLDLGVIAGTPEDAKQMQTMANSYKTLFGASLAQKNPDFGKVLNNLNIGVDGNRVALSLNIDEETVEKLSNQAGGGAAPAPAPPAAEEAAAPADPTKS